MPVSQNATKRAASTAVALASVFLLATCDLDKLTNVDTTRAAVLDSTDLALSITGGTDVTLGSTATVSVAATDADLNAALANATKEFTTSDATVISVVKETGVMTGLRIGTARITARVLAPELGAGITRSQNVRVRYKGIKVLSPSLPDSLTGLGQTRAVTLQGVNFQNAVVPPSLTADSLRVRVGGVLDTSRLGILGTTLTAKQNGTSYIVAFFDGFRDSVAVKVRQVAKTITFPTTDFTARHVNFNLTVPLEVRDVANALMTAPITWSTSDTTVATVNPATGVLRLKKVDTARVFATVDTVTRSQKIVVSQVVASLVKFAGDLQTDTVAMPPETKPMVTVLDSGGTPIAGVTVTFRIGTGVNAVITDSVQVTDADGRATLGFWKLGDLVNVTNTVIASAGGRTTTFTATGLAGAPRKLVFTTHPTSTQVGAVIAPSVVVRVLDSLENHAITAANSVTLSLSNPGAASLAGTLTKGAVNGVAIFDDITVDATGTGYVMLAGGAGLVTGAANAFDVFGAPAQLAFVTQPGTVGLGAVVSPPVKVEIRDADGALVANSSLAVTMSIAANPGSATLAGTLTLNAINGVATFSTLSLNQLGTGYTLQAASGALTIATSTAFNVVTSGPPAKLAFTEQPSSVAAGGSVTPAIKVSVQDDAGITVTSSSASITLSIDPAANPGGSALSGAAPVNAVNGVATFSSISLNKTGAGYKLVASAASLTSATSGTFTVTPGVATKLAFVEQPTNTVAGQNISPTVRVALQDANNNTVTTAPATSISIALTGCAGTLTGGLTTNTVNGVAQFTGVGISTQTNLCTLQATSSGLQSATSLQFSGVLSSGPVRLGFFTMPAANVSAGSTLGTIQVEIQAATGARVTSGTPVSVTLALGDNPGGATLSGPLSGNTSSGLVAFTGLSINKAGAGYTLVASTTSLQPGTSTPINVTAGAANKLAFVQQPTNTTAGIPFSPDIQVAVQDALGNVVTSASTNVTLQFSPSGAPFGGFNPSGATVTTAAVSGIATFSALRGNKASDGFILQATATGLVSVNSSAFNIARAPRSKLAFTTQPNASYTSGAAINVVVQTQDSVGNLYTDPAPDVTINLTGGNPSAVLSGATTVTPSAGVATFSALGIGLTGTLYQLNASASGFATSASSAFTINPGPAAKLTWLDQPQATFVNAPLNPAGQLPRIAVQDVNGNIITTNNSTTIRLTLTSGPVATFKSGASTVSQFDMTPTAGIATVPASVTMSQAGNFELTAATPSAGLTSSTSSSFAVAAFGPASKLAFLTQPTSVGYEIVMSPGVSVAVQDTYGNLVASPGQSIQLTLSSNPGNATLTGGNAVTTVAGMAQFADISLDRSGVGYALTPSVAAGDPLTAVASQAFNVSATGTLYDAAAMINGLVVDYNMIYFTESGAANGSLKKVLTRGGPVTSLASNLLQPAAVATDGVNVFWIETADGGTSQAKISRMPVNGGTIETVAGGLTIANGGQVLELVDGILYWWTGATVWKVDASVTSGTPVSVVTIAGGSTNFTISGGVLYYFAPGSPYDIRSIPLAGGPSTYLGVTNSYDTTPRSMMVVSGVLYFGAQGVRSIPIEGGVVTERTGHLWYPQWFVTDGLSLYNVEGLGFREVRRYPFDFSGSTLLGSFTRGPLALDDNSLFFQNDSFVITKVRK